MTIKEENLKKIKLKDKKDPFHPTEIELSQQIGDFGIDIFFKAKRDVSEFKGRIRLSSQPEELRLARITAKELDEYKNQTNNLIISIQKGQKAPTHAFIEHVKSEPGRALKPEDRVALFKEMVSWATDNENMKAAGYKTVEATPLKFGNTKFSDEYIVLEEAGFKEVSLDEKNIDPKLIRQYGDDAQVLVLMQYTRSTNNEGVM